jgi:hypothetical protein
MSTYNNSIFGPWQLGLSSLQLPFACITSPWSPFHLPSSNPPQLAAGTGKFSLCDLAIYVCDAGYSLAHWFDRDEMRITRPSQCIGPC